MGLEGDERQGSREETEVVQVGITVTKITAVSPSSEPSHLLFPLLGVLFPELAHLLGEALLDHLYDGFNQRCCPLQQ